MIIVETIEKGDSHDLKLYIHLSFFFFLECQSFLEIVQLSKQKVIVYFKYLIILNYFY